MNFFLIFIVIQSFLLTVVLISLGKRENNALVLLMANIFIGSFLFCILEGHFGKSLADSNMIRILHELVMMSRLVVIIYFLYSVLQKKVPAIIHWLWLLPVINITLDYIYRHLNLSFYKLGFYDNWFLNFSLYVKLLILVLLILHVPVFRRETRDSVDKNRHELIRLYWGKYFLYFLITLYGSLIVYIALTLLNGRLYQVDHPFFNYSALHFNVINFSLMAFFLFIFSYLAIRNPVILNTISPSSGEKRLMEIVLPEEDKTPVRQTELTKEEISALKNTLDRLMEEEEIFLNPELSLDKLAELADIRPRQLSQLIQQIYGKKYKEYVNHYRVLYAQKLLISDMHPFPTMFTIALESGFNSESSFYKIFKEDTQFTPKQYRENLPRKNTLSVE